MQPATEGQVSVLDHLLAAQARRRRLRRGGLTVGTLLLVVVAVLVLSPSRPQGAGVATATTATRAPVGSRAAALTLARQLLARLVVPPGSRPVAPSPVPPTLRSPSVGGDLRYTVDLHRFVLVREREPTQTVQDFLLAHVPAGMNRAGSGVSLDTTNPDTVLSVWYNARSEPSGLTNAQLSTAAMPAAGGYTLIRADASVSWFPPRSAAEQLTAAGFRSVTVTATESFSQSRTVTQTFTSPMVISRLVALVDSLPATPYPDPEARSCAPSGTGYRLAFTPGVVIYTGGCGDGDAITVRGTQQPPLWDPGVLAKAASELLQLSM